MDSKKIVLITGANQGVGYETALDLASHSDDYHVLIGSRSLERGEAAVAKLRDTGALKGTVSTVQLDVTSDESVKAAVQHVQETYNRLDVLLNNAGINILDENDRAGVAEKIFATNVFGPLRVTEAFLPLLRSSKEPRLYFVSSSTGSITHAADPNSQYYVIRTIEYRASKAALNMLMTQYNRLLAGEGFKVCCVDPGLVVTNLMDAEAVRKRGAPEANVAGKFFGDVIRGDKDADMGKVLGRYGIQLW